MATLKFDDRPPVGGPIFVGSYAPGDKVEEWEPVVGNTASLHAGPVTVIARIVAVNGRAYVGEVVGFEGWSEYAFQDTKPGDRVEFVHDQVFGFSR